MKRLRLAASALLGALLIGGIVSVVWAPSASAHTILLSATPADGATVSSAPAQVVFTFNEPVQSSTLQFAVTDANGTTVSKTAPTVAGTVVTQPLPPLANGTYTVAYRLVSVDGHPVSATTTFVVADPASTVSAQPSSAVSSPAVISTPAPTPTNQGSGGVVWKIAASLGILLVLVLLYVSISHSRSRRATRAERPTESPDRRDRD